MAFKKSFGRNELHEIVNISALKYIVKNWNKYESLIVKNDENDYDYNPKNICQKVISGYNKTLPVKYNKSSKYPSKTGRWFSKGGVGIQSLPRIIRHTICKGLWIDIDFKNCHPVILLWLCKKHNIKCDFLENYVNNRDELMNKWMNLLNIPRDEVKTLFLCALNGNLTKYNIPDWDKVLDEFNTIHKTISTHPEYSLLYEEVVKLNTKNIYAKTVNRILCNTENKCLEILYNTLDKRGLFNVVIEDMNFKCCALIFDGLQVPINDVSKHFFTDDNLKLLSSIIFNETSILLDITIKDFNECLEFPESFEDDIDCNEEFIIEDDADAVEVIINKYGHLMVNCNNIHYVKDGDIWTCNEKTVKQIIYNWIVKTTLKKQHLSGFSYYNRDKTSINKCIDMLENIGFTNNNKFLTDNQLKSKEYLPFINGVYSFREKKLLSYNDVPVQFISQIDRKFPSHNINAYNELMNKVIIPILPDEEERIYFFYCIARALAGKYEDKKWFVNKGSRNSGKGVVSKLLQNAFKVFVGIFNAGAFVSKKNENADDAKNLSWVVGKKDCRLIISNEVKEDVILNGVLIKSLSSGGDTILGRVNYKDEMEFLPQFMMMFMCNSLKGVDPVDALENCEQFYCKSKFVKEDELIEGQPFLKLRDENIKEIIEKPDIIDAFTLYILSHFKDTMEIPENVKISTEDMKRDMPLTLEQIILKCFRHSTNNKDRLFSDDIFDRITQNGYNETVNPKDVASILIKCNIGKRTKNGLTNINKEKKSGYENIIYVGLDQNVDE